MNRRLGIPTLIVLSVLGIEPMNGSARAAPQDAPRTRETASAGTLPAQAAEDGATVESTIRDAIGWALTKDQARLESIMAHDADFFIFHPDSKTTIRGYESFAKMIAGFMDPRFTATHFEVKDLATVFSIRRRCLVLRDARRLRNSISKPLMKKRLPYTVVRAGSRNRFSKSSSNCNP